MSNMRRKPSSSGGHSGHSGGGGHGGHRNNRSRNKFRSGGGSGGGGGGGGNDYQSLQRQKKHAMMQKDKYNAMARDMQANGDRVNAEYYYQHVEHYTRVIAEITEKEPPQQRERQQDADDQMDVAGGDQPESEQPEASEQPRGRGHREQRHHRSHSEAVVADEPVAEIPLPGSLFGEDDADRAANA